ncbi:MAG: type III-B CRISPR module-associated Cmr3 family protein [Pseudonocardiaceae bacterium]
MSTTWLAVTPLDTIMVRDGRPFDAGAASTARSVAPAPNTLGGVVRAALGRDAGRILGPIVSTEHEIVFPAPRDIVRDEQTVRRLSMVERADTAVSDLDDRHRLSHHLAGDGEPVLSDWITRQGLRGWLTGAIAAGRNMVAPPLRTDPAWVPENRLGLARHWSGPQTGAAAPGLLYAMTQLRPRDDTRFLVGCVDDQPIEIRDELVPFGGRGRLAEVTGDVTGEVLPPAPEDFPGGRLAVYLATPALLTSPFWSPPEATLAAVAVGSPQPVPSASPRGDFSGSRVLAWAVPAGSVFYLTFNPPDGAKRWATRYHGKLIPNQSSLPIVTTGFGTCLTGRW